MKVNLLLIAFVLIQNLLIAKTADTLKGEIKNKIIKNGHFVVSEDVIITKTILLHNAVLCIYPKVKIIVNKGAKLILEHCHLLGFKDSLWNGITLKDGASLQCKKNTLIEDAITAIDIPNSNTITSTNILNVENTIFNKNYIDISISNYTQTTGVPFRISNCVFTCRNLPFTSAGWPQTGTSNSLSTISADLRYPTTVTTGLAPPYLGQTNFTITNLKNPYSNQPSHIALRLNSVGVTTVSNSFTFDLGTSTSTTASDFNLFDAHGKFIEATNTNLKLFNNVFQNTRTYTVLAPPNYTSSSLIGGYAIDYNITNTMFGTLDLSAANINTGNKFWDCHTGINCKNVFKFNIQNALFRSTQTSTAVPNLFGHVGQMGINLNTNRFFYYIGRNEFTNIKNSINIPVAANLLPPGLVPTCSICVWGVYGVNMAIEQNTFSPVTSGSNFGTNYANRAISITCPNNNPIILAPAVQYSPALLGIYISRNKINNTFRGIHFNGLSGIKTSIADNDITLRDDIINPSSVQSGIELQNHMGTSNYEAQASITSNTLTGQNTTNTFVSLVDCIINTGIYSPSVTCNHLSNAGNGFLFNSTNSLTVWQGNEMTNLGRGLMLDNAGKIGQQGDVNTASNNKWLGSWSGLSETYVSATSSATSSILYVRNGYPFTPIVNLGTAFFWDLYNSTSLIPSNNGDYQCGGVPNNFVVPLPNQNDYLDAFDYYIAQTTFYRLLHHNDSVRNSGGNYNSFYAGLQTTNIGLFNDVEEKLFNGDFAQATSINNSINPSNTIETNYKLFYNLYISYYSAGNWNVDDSTVLFNLTQLCPGDNGACVLQARALYNSIYNTVINYPLCGAAGNKMINITNIKNSENKPEWSIDLFPNPNYGNFAIISKPEKEKLELKITDIKGAIVYNKQIETNKNIYVLDLPLSNGMYLVSIKNENGQSITKKMAVNK